MVEFNTNNINPIHHIREELELELGHGHLGHHDPSADLHNPEQQPVDAQSAQQQQSPQPTATPGQPASLLGGPLDDDAKKKAEKEKKHDGKDVAAKFLQARRSFN